MRFGCCSNMVAVQKNGTGIEIIEQLREIGYDYIEMPLSSIMALTDKEYFQLKERVLNSGIKCEACNNFFPPDMRLTGPEVDMGKIKNYLEKAFERASELGVEIIVFGSGPAKYVPEGFSMERAWQQLVALLRITHDLVEPYGITIVIEPLRKYECNIVNTLREGLKLAKEVHRDTIKCLVDLYHLDVEKEEPSAILEAGEYLRHVHFAMPKGRVYPKDFGEYDYKPFIENLKKINYQHRLSVEAYSNNFNEEAIASLNLLKKYF